MCPLLSPGNYILPDHILPAGNKQLIRTGKKDKLTHLGLFRIAPTTFFYSAHNLASQTCKLKKKNSTRGACSVVELAFEELLKGTPEAKVSRVFGLQPQLASSRCGTPQFVMLLFGSCIDEGSHKIEHHTHLPPQSVVKDFSATATTRRNRVVEQRGP
jgi:hypothetical protein